MTGAAGTAAAAKSAMPRPPFLLLKGMPDDTRVRMQAMGLDKPPVLLMPGNIRFLPLPGERAPGPEVHFGTARLSINATLPRVPCINCMADPDVHGKALAQAAEFMRRIDTPCLNHPLAVLRNSRDATARALAGIPGLRVPVTVKVNERTLAGLRRAMEAAGIRFPVLVRMAGDQGASSTVRVDGEHDWEALNPLPWGGRDVYLTQYVDYRDADGRFRNVRLAVVGNEVVPCYQVGSDEWLLRPEDLPAAPAERHVVDDVPAGAVDGLRGMLLEVAARLGLDCFAVDGSLRPDGSLLLFEANASNPTGRDMQLPGLAAAVRRLLAGPASWRHAGSGGV